MALTDNCDIFGAIHENGINRVVQHIMQQRPSLFNYGTALLQSNPNLLCEPIKPAPVVLQRFNPLITVEDPLPVPGTNGLWGLDFCVQLTAMEIDFHPGDVISLPPELSPPLAAQRLALHLKACAGLGCPDKRFMGRITLPPVEDVRTLSRGQVITNRAEDVRELEKDERLKRPPRPLPTDKLECFCLDLHVVGDVDVLGLVPHQRLLVKVDGLEIVDIKPEGLENSLECFMMTVLQLVVLPRISIALPSIVLDVPNLATITPSASPISAAIPNNPAIEDDQLKVFIDLALAPPGPPPPPGPPGPAEPPTTPGVIRPRTRTGPNDLTIGVAEMAVVELFNALRNNFRLSEAASGDFGPFTAGYTVEAHLENGSVELRDDNTIRIDELDLVFDTAAVDFGIDIPEICVGGFCIIPNPFGGCLVRAPRFCLFSGDPDIGFTLDLGGLIQSEISVTASPGVRYRVDPARTATMSDLDAEDAGIPNKWQIYIDPITVDLDLFDIADMVGDLLENAVDAAIDLLLGGAPGWAKDLIKAILGPVIDLIRALLDIPDDINEWLADLLGFDLSLFDLIVNLIADYLAKDKPLREIEDPFPILPASGGLIPVKIPVEFLGVQVNSSEMTLAVDIGG
jgi:hypothetical protein